MAHRVKIYNETQGVEEKTIDPLIVRAAEELKYDHSLYFASDPATVVLPLDHLILSRAREKGIRNAVALMAKAADGKIERRKPVEVVAESMGYFRVVDGNSTATIATAAGWIDLPCIVVEEEGSEPLAQSPM
ncbi:hypothetical protein [Agrobacterium sp. NPDC090283]|uniref:hypothetical protein n=1 Tax=Agrobacterium sp. NPDC090283 TaxID=3363920 RepID=UPI00383A653A